MKTAAPDPREPGDGGTSRTAPGGGRALLVVPQPQPSTGWFSGFGGSHGAVAAGVALVMGAGFVAGTQVFTSPPRSAAVAVSAVPVDTTADMLARLQGDVRSLKTSLDGLRAGAEDARQADGIRGLKRASTS